jgi:signal transduction histidine kinase
MELRDQTQFGEQKTQFVTTMSHEVRTPLSVILLSVRLLKQHGHQCSEDKRQEYLHHIEAAAKQMNRLLNEQLIEIGADPAPSSLLDR